MRGLLKVFIIGFIIVNIITIILSYLLPMGKGFTNTYALILFIEGAIVLVLGGLLGTFLGKIMFLPFGYAKKRDTTGRDESDEKRTYTGVSLLFLGTVLLVESILLALTSV